MNLTNYFKVINMKKTHKIFPNNLTYSRHLLQFGSCGLKILSDLKLTKNQLNSLERFINQKLKNLTKYSRKYKVWSTVFTNRTLTKLSLESRMGKGKGSIYTEVLFLKQGSIIYEFQNLKLQQIIEVYKFLKNKLPVKLLLVFKK